VEIDFFRCGSSVLFKYGKRHHLIEILFLLVALNVSQGNLYLGHVLLPFTINSKATSNASYFIENAFQSLFELPL